MAEGDGAESIPPPGVPGGESWSRRPQRTRALHPVPWRPVLAAAGLSASTTSDNGERLHLGW